MTWLFGDVKRSTAGTGLISIRLIRKFTRARGANLGTSRLRKNTQKLILEGKIRNLFWKGNYPGAHARELITRGHDAASAISRIV